MNKTNKNKSFRINNLSLAERLLLRVCSARARLGSTVQVLSTAESQKILSFTPLNSPKARLPARVARQGIQTISPERYTGTKVKVKDKGIV